MPTLRRTSATLIAAAVLTGGVETPAHAVPAEAAPAISAYRTAAPDTTVKKKLSRKARNKKIGRALLARRGWSKVQFACLSRLWNRESNWNHRARNPYSGAYGIPQALPPHKMASSGRDWRTNPRTQIKWGLKYIKGRYGSPCGAWAHALARGWY